MLYFYTIYFTVVYVVGLLYFIALFYCESSSSQYSSCIIADLEH